MKLNEKSNLLIGQNYFLKNFKEQDIEKKYIDWLNDSEVNKYLEIRFKKQTKSYAKEYINTFYENEEKYLWGIYNNNNKILIGTSSLYKINRYHGLANISIMIGDKKYWGSSATTEAKRLIINYAFKKLKIRKIIASSYSVNLSINFTLKKLGFSLESKLKQNRILENGKYCDEYKWGLLKNEWTG